MKSNVFLYVLSLFMFSAPVFCYAKDDAVKLSAQIRTRGILDAKDFNNETPANRSTLMRVRLNANFRPTKDISGFFQLQDSRVFGSEPNTLSSINNVDLHQGYLYTTDLLVDGLSLKAGRMVLVYGGQRLVGAVGWHNVGRAFDGTLVAYKLKEEVKFDLFATKLVQQADPEMSGDTAAYLGGLYLTLYNFDVYALLEMNRHQTLADSDDLQRLTLGTYRKGSFGMLDYETEAAFQLGTRINPNAKKRQDVSAFMATGSVGYTFDIHQKPRIAVGYDYLSGQTPDDTDYKVFDTLFATNHKFYGFMDYFLNIPVHTGGVGLQDLMLKFQIIPHKKVTLKVDFHQFLSAQTVENMNSYGQELDLTLVAAYHKALNFTLGLSVFLPDALMESRFKDNSDMAVWVYLMTTANF